MKVVCCFFLLLSQEMTEEMSFQVSLENCQGFSFPNGSEKFIPVILGLSVTAPRGVAH